MKIRIFPYGLQAKLIIALHLLPIVLGGQHFNFQHFMLKDGLSHSTVRHLVQDQQGFLWIGTGNGLYRFDGQAFQEFRFSQENPRSLSSDIITELMVDTKGRLWVGTDSGLNLLHNVTGDFERIALPMEDGESAPFSIHNILESTNNRFWIGTEKGLWRLEEQDHGTFKAKRFEHTSLEINEVFLSYIHNIIEDTNGDLWLIRDTDAWRLTPDTGVVQQFDFPDWVKLTTNTLRKSTLDKQGRILILLAKYGLFHLDPNALQPTILPLYGKQIHEKFSYLLDYQSIFLDSQERMWVGTNLGIFVKNDGQSDFIHITHEPDELGTLSHPNIEEICEGKNGEIWIATRGGGLNVLLPSGGDFRFLRPDLKKLDATSGAQVRTIQEDREGNLWVGYLFSGVDQFRFNERMELQKIRSFRSGPASKQGLLSDNIIQIVEDSRGHLWMGTNGKGLNRFDPATGIMEAFVSAPEDPNTLVGNQVWGIAEDQDGYIWVADFLKGLSRLDPISKKVKRYAHDPENSNSLSVNNCKALLIDSDGMIWVGTDAGLNRFDPRTETFTHFFHDPEELYSLSNSYVISLLEDQEKNIWVGTSLGLNKLSAAERKGRTEAYRFERFYEHNGLPSNIIHGIQNDAFGNLWVSTDYGIARLLTTKPKNTFAILDLDESLKNQDYLPKAHFFSENTGLLFFGNRTGLLLFRPKGDEQDKFEPDIVLSSVSTYQLDKQEGQLTTDYFIHEKDQLELTHLDQMVTFDLSVLNGAKGHLFEYQLKGFSEEWFSLGEDLKITHTNLTTGKYSLKARGLNMDNTPTESVHLLNITMLPPWWKTWWAYALYLLNMTGLIFLLYRFQLRRALEKQETAHLKEIDRAKSKFFTNISHEFRTPLTIISGMADNIKSKPTNWAEKGSTIIKQNTLNLLNLINQILDLRKLESKNLKLNMMQGDIIEYLRYLKESYQSYAENEGLQMHFLPSEEKIIMDYDPDKILRIVSNLLSNAIKYNQPGGHIYLQVAKITSGLVGKESLQLRIRDTGAGIPEDKLTDIFSRFYQVNEPGEKKVVGSGIGLALTHELVEFMNGEINVESNVGVGTTFTMILPINRSSDVSSPFASADLPKLEDEITAATLPEIEPVLSNEGMSAANNLPHLLIVEDNPQIVQILIVCLEDHYQLEIASNGKDGIEKAIEQVPDLIVSDVMMPEKDGLELTATLKSDQRTSHIPIVLLTAKSDIDSKISGLEQGADAYLAKPFEQRELMVRLEKLLELRKKLQARYRTLSLEQAPENKEDEFVQKVRQVVLENLSDDTFNIPQLCRKIALSRAQLHNKLKALTGQSTSHFIRAIRLQEAKKLLEHADLNVSEVGYEVGFKNPAHFSTAFQEKFGIPPSKTRK